VLDLKSKLDRLISELASLGLNFLKNLLNIVLWLKFDEA
jgi:hypothetical protein